MSRVIVSAGLAAVAAVAVATFAVACGGRNDVTADKAASDAGNEAEAALPPGVEFIQGPYSCCKEGVDCCTPGDRACHEYEHCSGLGGNVSAKAICSRCCPGLKEIFPDTVNAGQCVPGLFYKDAFCAACGDGLCRAEDGENKCNCPEDCT